MMIATAPGHGGFRPESKLYRSKEHLFRGSLGRFGQNCGPFSGCHGREETRQPSITAEKAARWPRYGHKDVGSLVPHLPEGGRRGERVWHSSELLAREEVRARAAETWDRGVSRAGVARQTAAILAQPDRTEQLRELELRLARERLRVRAQALTQPPGGWSSGVRCRRPASRAAWTPLSSRSFARVRET